MGGGYCRKGSKQKQQKMPLKNKKRACILLVHKNAYMGRVTRICNGRPHATINMIMSRKAGCHDHTHFAKRTAVLCVLVACNGL